MSTDNPDQDALDFLGRLERQHKSSDAARPRRNSRMTNFFAGFQQQQAVGRGGFDAGRFDRITEEWNPGQSGPNQLFRMGAGVLRERARDLVINNPGASSAVESYISNVIECGITPQPQIDGDERREAWLRAWNRWGGMKPSGKYECDLENDSTIYELAAIWLSEIVVAGGCLTHYVELGRKGRTIPLSIELISEERFATDVDTFGRNPKTRNRVRNGIEVDNNGQTTAYHVRVEMPNDLEFSADDVVRIPADRCEYAFFKRRPNQKRGWSLLSPVVVWLWALGYYTDNELYASAAKSSWSYMIKTSPDNEAFDFADLNDSSPERGTTDIYGNQIEKLEPGMVFRGMHGDEISAIGPNVPGGDSMPWLMMIQRSIAIGTNQSYEEVYRDYSKGSFSSVRAAMNSDRKRYRKLQRFAINHFCNPTWSRFVGHAVRSGLETFPTPSDWAQNEYEWSEVSWQPPGWESSNPKDDATARDLDLKNGVTSVQQEIEKRGGDYRVTRQQNAEHAEWEAENMPQPPAPAPPADANGVIPDSPDDNDEPAEDSADSEDANATPDA